MDRGCQSGACWRILGVHCGNAGRFKQFNDGSAKPLKVELPVNQQQERWMTDTLKDVLGQRGSIITVHGMPVEDENGLSFTGFHVMPAAPELFCYYHCFEVCDFWLGAGESTTPPPAVPVKEAPVALPPCLKELGLSEREMEVAGIVMTCRKSDDGALLVNVLKSDVTNQEIESLIEKGALYIPQDDFVDLLD